jgi:Fe-Mn family superoxide dismutase
LPALTVEKYAAKTWNLSGLHGISDNTLTTHFELYEGYVKNTNLLNEQISELGRNGGLNPADPHFSELRRRLGFEFNGMRLHEYYFENLAKDGGGNPPATLRDALARSFGDVEAWKKDFVATGGMRGVGWAVALHDPRTGKMSNHWITLHEDGNIAGLTPIVVMDVWEHAYILDHKPSERSKYIEAFFANLDWNAAAARLRPADAGT